MKVEFKNSFTDYFSFYYRILGKHIVFNLLLCILISFIDGMGLSMFIPLLQIVGDGGTGTPESMGKLHFLIDLIKSIGFELNIKSVLACLVILFLLKGVLKYAQLTYQVGIRHLFMKRVRNNLVDDLHNLSYQGFLKLEAGQIQNTLITEVQRLFQSMNSYFNAVQYAIMLVTYIIMAFLANYQFALLIAVGAGLTNFLYRKIFVAVKNASRELSKRGSDFNGYLIQAINHFKYLKATNYFSLFGVRLKKIIEQTEFLNKRIGNYQSITASMREPVIIVVVALVIYIQLLWMNTGLTSILLSLLLFYRALSFLLVVQNHWQTFMQSIGAMYTVTEFTAEMKEMREHGSVDLYTGFNQSIVFQDVSFSYNNGKTILNGVSVNIPKNKTIALIGESGAGKTTLANMIAALIQPQQGRMLIDGKDIRDFNLSSYRNKVGYILQEPVIFNDNIFNNVTFWADPSPENYHRFYKAIADASLTDFINSLQDKENTKLGDNGILISGGQKQRISIARELYKDPDILIMDEATSALDSETERAIQENIEKLHGAYTIVIIAHRLSTIKNADVIYLLEQGKVIASGTFDIMMNESQRFKRMVSFQEF